MSHRNAPVSLRVMEHVAGALDAASWFGSQSHSRTGIPRHSLNVTGTTQAREPGHCAGFRDVGKCGGERRRLVAEPDRAKLGAPFGAVGSWEPRKGSVASRSTLRHQHSWGAARSQHTSGMLRWILRR